MDEDDDKKTSSLVIISGIFIFVFCVALIFYYIKIRNTSNIPDATATPVQNKQSEINQAAIDKQAALAKQEALEAQEKQDAIAKQEAFVRQEEIVRQEGIVRQEEIVRQEGIARQEAIVRQEEIAKKEAIARQEEIIRQEQIAKQEAIERQEKLVQKICTKDRAPPCKDGFRLIKITDNNSKESTECCVSIPTRNDTNVINSIMNKSKEIIKGIEVNSGIPFSISVNNILVNNIDTFKRDSVQNMINTRVYKISEALKVISTDPTSKYLSAIIIDTISNKLLSLNEQIEKAILKTTDRIANRKKEIEFNSLSKIRLTPIEWTNLTYDAYLSKLNSQEIKTNTSYLVEFKRMKSEAERLYNKELSLKGMKGPFVVGPLNNLPVEKQTLVKPIIGESQNIEKFAEVDNNEQNKTNNDVPESINEIINNIVAEYCMEYILIILEDLTLQLLDVSQTEIQIILQNLFDDAIKFFDNAESIKLIDAKMCGKVDGKLIDGFCSFKDKDSCDKSYNWTDIKANKNSTNNYTEFRDGKCVIVNPILRQTCEDQGLEYDEESQSCKINDNFCKKNNLESVESSDNKKDCKMEIGKELGQIIFGAKVFSELDKSYDSKDYKECDPKQIEGSKAEEQLKKAIQESIKLLAPLNIPGIIYTINSNKTCISNTGCLDGKVLENGICRDKCKDGYKTDGTDTCFKQYPELDKDNIGTESITKTVTKKSVKADPKPLTYCEPDKSKENSLCYDKCNDGFKSDGATMCYKQYSDFEANGQAHTVTSITKKISPNTGKPLSTCDPSKSKENALCYEKCKDTFKSDGATMCYKQYSDFESNGQVHTVTSVTKKITTNTGKPLSYCEPDKSKENALCYKKCNDGFKSDGATMCYKQYSDFEANGLLHTVTSVTKKVTTNTGKPLSTCDAGDEVGGALCYPKCKDGFNSDNAAMCYKNTPLNWPGTTSLTHLQHKTIYSGPGKPLTDCKADEDKEGLICYPKCKDGYASDKASLCYKSTPTNWPGENTLTHLQHKTIYSGPGKPLTDCSNNQDKDGALCYPKCKDGFTSDKATLCYRSTPVNWPGTNTVTHLQHKTSYSPAKVLDSCGANEDKDAGLCYPKCRDGYKGVGPVCWKNLELSYTPSTYTKDSYGRGAGTIPGCRCNGGRDGYGNCYAWALECGICEGDNPVKDAGLCYPNCRSGYNGVGPVCWGTCRAGDVDTGALCREKCRDGYRDVAGVCWLNDPSYERGVGKPLQCAPGLEQRGALCYDNCSKLNANGVEYERRNDNIEYCSTKCPPGFTNVGIGGCQRESYNRGAGEPLKCAPGLEQRGALCYDNCAKNNANGIEYERRNDNIDMCSTKCPPGFTNVGIGGCQRDSYTRGAGKPMVCADGLEQRGALCYNNCAKNNANGIEYERRNDNIDMCSTKCPPGFTNVGIGGCQRESYTRGAGKPMKCATGQTQKGALCYEPCPTGTTMQTEGLCSQDCPPGSKDFGAGCTREAYNRGIGEPMKCNPGQISKGALCYEPCPSGTSMQSEGLCSQDCPSGSKDFGVGCTREAYNRGIGEPMKCAEGQMQKGALCYEPCPPGTTMQTDGLCSQDCPPTAKDFGVGCTRDAYNRGVGKPMKCTPTQQMKGALCYEACPPGMALQDNGDCKQVCPTGTTEAGESCVRESYNRGSGLLPFSIYVKERLAPYKKA